MSAIASLLLFGQALPVASAAGVPPLPSLPATSAAPQRRFGGSAKKRSPIATSEATVRILRPARISLKPVKPEAGSQGNVIPQKRRDTSGTPWFEFS